MKSVIVFLTTFSLFISEAIIHYNLGNPEKKFVWPTGKEILEIVGIVGIFSLINAVLVWGIENYSLKNKYLFF